MQICKEDLCDANLLFKRETERKERVPKWWKLLHLALEEDSDVYMTNERGGWEWMYHNVCIGRLDRENRGGRGRPQE